MTTTRMRVLLECGQASRDLIPELLRRIRSSLTRVASFDGTPTAKPGVQLLYIEWFERMLDESNRHQIPDTFRIYSILMHTHCDREFGVYMMTATSSQLRNSNSATADDSTNTMRARFLARLGIELTAAVTGCKVDGSKFDPTDIAQGIGFSGFERCAHVVASMVTFYLSQ